MSYKNKQQVGPVDFINTYDLEPMAQQAIPKASFWVYCKWCRGHFTLRENIRALTTNSLFLRPLCDVWKIQAQRLNLMVKATFTNYYGTCCSL